MQDTLITDSYGVLILDRYTFSRSFGNLECALFYNMTDEDIFKFFYKTMVARCLPILPLFYNNPFIFKS